MLRIFGITWFFSAAYAAGDDVIFISGFESCNPELECCANHILFNESFPDGDHGSWGGDWLLPGFEVESEEIVNGQARFRPISSNYSLARIVHPLQVQDVEVNFTLYFEHAETQGIGFYVRSNGGYLNQTFPTGEGYAVFVEKFVSNTPGLGLWYERDGAEISFIRDYSQDYELNDETPYRVKFQVYQLTDTTTQLRAKLWALGDSEPADWQVEHIDDYMPLQNTPGHFFLDSWSTQQAGEIIPATRVDDIEIKQLCNPLMEFSALETLETGLQFAEGPVWHENQLFFSDITANTVYQWDETNGVQAHNDDSGQANGLLSYLNDLYAAEHLNRRVSINDGNTTLIDNYEGNAFNSPNDLVMSDAGMLYFTDPDYGLNGRPREIPFNGIYSYSKGTGITAEVMADQFNNQPNGIGISPDQQSLYWSDSQAGELNKMTVNLDGSLTPDLTLADNLTTPDGLCLDHFGNIFVATWNGALEVFAPTGDHWGSIEVPETAVTNCTFAGANKDQLYITSQHGLHRLTR
ncbi:MAG: SMP-30/gluconolactonase/LRE family protein [Marinicella sp.]